MPSVRQYSDQAPDHVDAFDCWKTCFIALRTGERLGIRNILAFSSWIYSGSEENAGIVYRPRENPSVRISPRTEVVSIMPIHALKKPGFVQLRL
jgi:hypothetical protein